MITRRKMLQALGIGGLLPFVKTEPAPPPEVTPLTVSQLDTSQVYTHIAPGSTSFDRVPCTGIAGSVSFSLDGVNWETLGKLTSDNYYTGFGGDE